MPESQAGKRKIRAWSGKR